MSEKRPHGTLGARQRPGVCVRFRNLRWLRRPLWLLLLVPLVGGCFRAQAKTMPDGPPLDVPAPPPRVVEPVGNEAPQPIPLPEEPRRPPPLRPRVTAPPRVEAPKPDAAKPEGPKVDAAPAVDVPKAADEAAKQPATTLQTTAPAEQGEVERGIRATMARASADLNRIDYRVLNAAARDQYDSAKRFIEQADEAIRNKNLVFAKSFADKAAGLAAQLGGK